jgi:hypothetical protein
MSSRRVRDHLLGILAVLGVFSLLLVILRPGGASDFETRRAALDPYLHIPHLDLSDPLHRAILREAITSARPDNPSAADSILQAIDDLRREEFTTPGLKAGAPRAGLTADKTLRLAPMFVRFVGVYLLVLILTYYGAQTLGTYRFVTQRARAEAEPRHTTTGRRFRGAARAVIRTAVTGILFAPAYVIAYSFRSRFETDSLLIMVVLGVISNGLLITYANKFTLFLVHESRKGYVETALAKNLRSSYRWNTRDGIPLRAVFLPSKRFPGHILDHIVLNARHQYRPTVKEQASFVITGLVIIEMALNIQGHLCYELLQTVLFRDYQVTLAIVVALFLLVKATDIVVDVRARSADTRYGIVEQQ